MAIEPGPLKQKMDVELTKKRVITPRQLGLAVTLVYALLGALLIVIPAYQAAVPISASLGTSLRDWIYLASSSVMVYFLAQFFTRKLIQGDYRVSLDSGESERDMARRRARLQLTTEAILSSSTQGIFGLDADGRVTFINRAACEMLGFEPDELIGESHHTKVHHHRMGGTPYPEDQCPIYTALRQGAATQGEESYIRKDGTQLPIEFTCNPLWDAGIMRGAVVFFKDISQRLTSESRLRVHSTVFESIMEGVAVTDANVNIISVNPAFTHITGFKPEEVLGKNPRVMKSGRHDKEFYRSMWDAINQHGSCEIWNRRKSGSIQPEWLNITRVCDEAGTTTNYVASFIDTSAIRASQEQLHHLAHHDNLTGLPNRLLFNDRLEQSCKRARREACRVAILFMDLDDFKKINDTLGHQVGDEVLRQAARRIKALLRKQDTVARLGGDEFVILLDRLDRPEDASLVARKVLSTLKQPFKIAERDLYIGVSIGISIYPQDGEDSNTLVKNADISMYRAKQMGKNHFQFYTEELSLTVNRRMELETDLRMALEANQLQLYYQPQVSLADRRIVAAEALLRWHHPGHGLIPAAEFIQLAEETGLILPIGEWALNEACRQACAWDRQGLGGIRISVNISCVQVQRTDLFALVQAALRESGLQPSLLELEFAENCIMGGPEKTVEVLARLKAFGVGISIDDFGSGYSSISYLQRLPLCRLKMSRSLLEGVPSNSTNSALVDAVVSVGGKFGIPVTASGIEQEGQMRFALEIGCEAGQGFLHGNPLPPDQFQQQLLVEADSSRHQP